MKGWNSQEKPSIHHYLTPQVTFPQFQTHAYCRTKALISLLSLYYNEQYGSSCTCRTVQEKPVLCITKQPGSESWTEFFIYVYLTKTLIILRPGCIASSLTLYTFSFCFITRFLWRDALEEREREHTVSEEEVRTVRERIYSDLLQQGKCVFPAALTHLICTVCHT